jgi:hypothetical protein
MIMIYLFILLFIGFKITREPDKRVDDQQDAERYPILPFHCNGERLPKDNHQTENQINQKEQHSYNEKKSLLGRFLL